MFRIIKSQLAEFSYFLEKYFGITLIVWSILFIAGACALIGIAISKTAEIIYKKKKHKDCSFLSLYLLLTGITGFVMNVLVSQAYTWDSKLQREIICGKGRHGAAHPHGKQSVGRPI